MEYSYPTAFSAWGDEERTAIDRVLSSGRFTIGDEVRAFEKEFAGYHGMRHGVMVNSGSSANLIAVASLFHKSENPLKRGDKALVPALAWATTYAPLVQYGLDLILADCDGTWNTDIYSRGFDPKDAKLIVGASILGNPAPLAALKTAAGILGAYFIEDNCESAGAINADGKLCGTFGDLNTFSFFYSHQISAIEGGMILTNDAELAAWCRVLRAHGWTRDITTPISFDDEYNFVAFGYNVRPLEMHAAIAREQLKKLDRGNRQRWHNFKYFREQVRDLPVTMQDVPDNASWPSPFGIAFTVKDSETRARLAAALRERGIDCRLPTGGSFRLHSYGAPWSAQETPKADAIHRTGIFLGNGPLGLSEQIENAVNTMRDVL